MQLSSYSSHGTMEKEIPVAILIGILSHIFFYKNGEHHMEGPLIFWLHTFALSMLLYGKTSFEGAEKGVRNALIIFGVYVFALFTSIVVYRKFFHRLRKFPGPAMASVTKLWHTMHTLDCQNHVLLDDLYKRYGDFVRTGPTEITVFTPEVKWAVDGPLNKCTKAVWYDILLPLTALNTSRSKTQHDQRRRVWDQAVTVKSLEAYEKRIQHHVSLLEKQIATTAGNPINITRWFYFLAFDVMGDFAFEKSFDMLESKQWHYAVLLLRRALGLLGPMSSVPWLVQLAFSLNFIPVIRDWNRMLGWCADRMAEQVEARNPGKTAKNISSVLIDHSRKAKTLQQDASWLNGDSVALIVAGSDTVASTLVNLFYRLAIHPDHATRIREELESIDSIYESKRLKELKHMNGAINEVLRLHPSVPTGGYREAPPEGLEIAGTWIPGKTTIVAPRYTMGRLEKSFQCAEEFIPERWYSKPEMVADKKSFTPFNIGRYACVGKNLALAEIRFVAALLLSKYQITLAPGEDGITVWKSMKDQFTAVPGKLDLVFIPLEKAQCRSSVT